jgi:hypothetical protein
LPQMSRRGKPAPPPPRGLYKVNNILLRHFVMTFCRASYRLFKYESISSGSTIPQSESTTLICLLWNV